MGQNAQWPQTKMTQQRAKTGDKSKYMAEENIKPAIFMVTLLVEYGLPRLFDNRMNRVALEPTGEITEGEKWLVLKSVFFFVVSIEA